MNTRHRDAYLARQPILDRHGRLAAYELLFRAAPGGTEAGVADGTAATLAVLERAFARIGIDVVAGAARAFINLNEELLMSRHIERLPAQRVVLEILETVPVSERVVRRCHELKAAGFRLALDDFSAWTDAHEALLSAIDIVKLDLPALDDAALTALVRRLRLTPTRILAEKVESRAQARTCLALGVDLLQGFLFARPSLVGA